MTQPILPGSLGSQFEWDLSKTQISRKNNESIASVAVKWKGQSYTIRVHKDGEFRDMDEAKEALRNEIDTAIILMARYISNDVKMLQYDNHRLTKTYMDKTEFIHKKRNNQPISFNFDDDFSKTGRKLQNEQKESLAYRQTLNRFHRIEEARKLKRILVDKHGTLSEAPLIIRRESPPVTPLKPPSQPPTPRAESHTLETTHLQRRMQQLQDEHAQAAQRIGTMARKLPGVSFQDEMREWGTISEELTRLEQLLEKASQPTSPAALEIMQMEHVKQIESLEREIEHLHEQQHQVVKLKEALKDVTEKKEEKEEKNKQLVKQLSDIKMHLQQLSKERDALAQRLQESEREEKRAEDIQTVKDKLTIAQAQVKKLKDQEEQNKALQEEVKSHDESLTAKEKQIAALKDDIRKLKGLKSENDQLKLELEDSAQLQQSQSKNVAALRKQVVELDKERQETLKDVAALQEKIKEDAVFYQDLETNMTDIMNFFSEHEAIQDQFREWKSTT